jgi:hypothetical protein
MSLNSIQIPTIQFSHVFLHSPTEEHAMGCYAAPNGNLGQFETTMCAQVVWVKEQILKNWISEKEKEVTFLEGRASAVRAISQFEKVASTHHASLKAHATITSSGNRGMMNSVRDVDFEGVCMHSLASTLIAKINGLVIAEEDRKLAAAIKKMELDKPAIEAAAQAPSNELLELKKMVTDLGKKVDLSTKKVSDKLYQILCVCAGHLMLTPPLLENLILTTVEVGQEEVEWQEEGQGERESRTHQKTGLKGGAVRQSRCQKLGEIQEKRQRQGRRVLNESEVEGQQEERWQEVGASFGLQFRTDSLGSVSSVGKYAFSDVYGLDWDLLVSDCRFLCLSFPPSILLNRRLLPLVQICLVVFSCISTVPKFNILDYSTYPDISTLVEQDLLFLSYQQVCSRLARQES